MTRPPLDRRRLPTRSLAGWWLLAVVTAAAQPSVTAPPPDPTPALCAEVSTPTADGPYLLAGRNGWVFNGRHLTDDLALEAMLPYLERLARALAAQDTELVMVLVPTPGMVHEEQLPEQLPADLAEVSMSRARSSYHQARRALASVGIVAPDILGAAIALVDEGGDFFFRLDHHWTSAGARAAAVTTAEAIRAASLRYPGLDTVPHETEFVGTTLNESSYRRAINEVCGAALPDEPLERYHTALTGDAPAGLFAELPVEVALVGTSFSRRVDPERDFNFAGFLGEQLSLVIANEAQPGGGIYPTLEMFLLDPERVRPSYLVWEVPWWLLRPSPELRQLVPAAAGPCAPERELFTTVASSGGATSVELPVPALELPREGAFVVIDFERAGILDFAVSLHFGSGEDLHEIERPQRMHRHRRIFLDLPDRGGQVLRSLRLSGLPDDGAGDLTVRICPQP